MFDAIFYFDGVNNTMYLYFIERSFKWIMQLWFWKMVSPYVRKTYFFISNNYQNNSVIIMCIPYFPWNNQTDRKVYILLVCSNVKLTKGRTSAGSLDTWNRRNVHHTPHIIGILISTSIFLQLGDKECQQIIGITMGI